MSGRSGSALLALVLLFASTQAFARTQSFLTGTPFGLGLAGGFENRPESDFTAAPRTTSSNYASYFAIEPFVDIGNAVFRGHIGWHFYPLQSGAGSDSSGAFTESSDAGSLEYGFRVELAPWMAQNARSRLYLVAGVNDSIIKLKNLRKYNTGTQAGRTNSAQLQGTTAEINGGLGFEFWAVQNWSIAVEAGYAARSAGTFHYRTSTDEAGNTITSGATATDSAGNNKAFHAYTPYGQVVLNLNL